MTAATPLARYSAVEGALASGFATAQLHHAAGHDRRSDESEIEWFDPWSIKLDFEKAPALPPIPAPSEDQ